MSFITDIRNVSESALGQLADRFSDLPRPLLAAIGAGDVAVEKLAELRESLAEGWDLAPIADVRANAVSSVGSVDTQKLQEMASEARDFAEDLPARVSKVAAEVIESMEKFAAEAPAKTQKLVAELPEKAADFRAALSPEQLKEAVEGYTQLAGMIYGSLADRGDKTWSKVIQTADVKVVAPAKTAMRTAANATTEGAARTITATKSTATKAANRATATKAAAAKPAAKATATAPKPTAQKATAASPAAARPAAAKSTAAKSAAAKPATAKPATVRKAAAKPPAEPAAKPAAAPKPVTVKPVVARAAKPK